MSIEAALKEADAAAAAGQLCYQEIATKHGVSRSTLSRRHRRVSGSTDSKNTKQQRLTPEEELDLVDYIKQLPINISLLPVTWFAISPLQSSEMRFQKAGLLASFIGTATSLPLSGPPI